MKPKTAILIGAGLACAGLLASAWNSRRLTVSDEAERERLVKAQAKLRTDLVHLADLRAWDEERRTTAQALLDELTAARKSPAPRPDVIALSPEQATAMAEIAAVKWGDLVLETKPELQAQYLANYRAGLASTYGPLFRKLGLSSAQVERFSDVMVAAAGRDLDLKSTIRAQALKPTDPSVLALSHAAEAETRRAQLAVLGETGYREFQEFEAARPVQGMVNTLAGQLAFTDSPLTEEQAARLAKLLLDSGVPRIGAALDDAMYGRRPAEGFRHIDQTLSETKKILAPRQYARVEAELLRQHNIIELFNEIRQTPDPLIGFQFGRH